jgi:hypothetical protein
MSNGPDPEPHSVTVLEPQSLAPGKRVTSKPFRLADGDYFLIASTASPDAPGSVDCVCETFGSEDGKSFVLVRSQIVGAAGSCPRVVRYAGTPAIYITRLTNVAPKFHLAVEASLVIRASQGTP